MDRVFEKQVGRNIEAYVDDMVIKSKDDEDFLKDVAETLSQLRKAGLKLNPQKCTFGAREGKFLGHIVTPQGINANPTKIEAILETKFPKTIKEMQSLGGKLVALGRFLAKSTEKTIPIFQMLRQQTKGGKVVWSE